MRICHKNEYKNQKNELLKEKQSLLESIGSLKSSGIKTQFNRDIFLLASKCLTLFECGTVDERKSLIRGIFESLILKDGVIEYKLKKPFEIIRDGMEQIKELEKERFECLRMATEKEELSLSNSSVLVWQGRQESNPR